MLLFLIWRDVKTRYAQSILGLGWALVNPVVQMLIFTVIFGNLTQMSSDGAPYAVFSYTALVPWTYFANALTGSSQSLSNAVYLISKVYFPRLILPLATVLDRLVDFGIALSLLFVLMLIFQVTPTVWVLFLPVLILIMVLSVTGLGLIASSLAIQFRDVSYGMSLGSRILMYLSPVIYPASIVPEQLRLIYALNPMVGVIEGFRSALLGTNPMPWDLIAVSGFVSIILLLLGLIVFQSREHLFADIV